MAKKQRPIRDDDNWAPGMMADGSVEVYPVSELKRLIAERDERLSDDDEKDDLSDLDDIEGLFVTGGKA